jgi:chloramphenicol 3-O-phosphotransferase
MAPGTIIYLNGTSSSGKTSITRALDDQLDQPYLHCPIDLFETMIPDRQIQRGVFPDLNAIQSGFTACIAALASAGNNVVVDDVICEPFGHPEGQTPITTRELLQQRVRALHVFDILYVKVYCPLPFSWDTPHRSRCGTPSRCRGGAHICSAKGNEKRRWGSTAGRQRRLLRDGPHCGSTRKSAPTSCRSCSSS